MKHPEGPLGLNQPILEKPWVVRRGVTYKPNMEIQPHAVCLDCGVHFWTHTWDELFAEMEWHYSKHVIHVWDECAT